MSSLKKSTSRKRPYASDSCNDSSESEFEVIPVKLRKHVAHGSNLSVIQQLKKFFIWMRDFPVKDFFASAVRMGSVPDVTLIDDDEDCTVVAIQTDSTYNVSSRSKNKNPLRTKFRLQDNFVTLPNKKTPNDHKNSRDSELSLSQINGHNPFKTAKSNSRLHLNCREGIVSGKKLSRHSLEFSHDTQKPTSSLRFSKWKNPHSTENCSSSMNSDARNILLLSNNETSEQQMKWASMEPGSDIKMLFDAHSVTFPEQSTADTDDIEILSEISSRKSLPKAHRYKEKREITSFPSRNSLNSYATGPFSSSSKLVTSVSQPKSNTAFTTHEMVRLQERAQYQLLLEKYSSGPLYQPIIKSVSSQNAETQVDLTADDLNMRRSAFTKETLAQPVSNFIERYLKPCQLIEPTSTEGSSKSCVKAEGTTQNEEDDDDEPVILDVKLPKYRLHQKYKSDYFSPEWISELKITVNEETTERLKIVEEQERQLEEYRRKRAASYAAEKRQRDHLRLTGVVLHETINLEEDVSAADFPELTPEMERIIDNALVPTPQNELLCSLKGQFQILRKDMDTLSGLSWLNDEIINYYMALIVERSKMDNYPSVHAFNSFFYPTLKAKGYSAVRRWTRKVDIFAHDLNLVPLHLGVHWCLAVIDHRHKKIQYFDSMGGREEHCLEVLRDYVAEEKKDKKGANLDPLSWTLEVMKDIPHQMNGSDCGMFTLKYGEYITRNAEITFTQKNMQYFRRRMVYEIMSNQLL